MNRYCNRCDNEVTISEVDGYPYQCDRCCEDLYEVETYEKKYDIHSNIPHTIAYILREGYEIKIPLSKLPFDTKEKFDASTLEYKVSSVLFYAEHILDIKVYEDDEVVFEDS